MKYRRIVPYICLLFVLSLPLASAQVGLLQVSVDRKRAGPEENIGVETTLVNNGDEVRTELILLFRLIRKKDGGIIYSGSESLDLAPREVKMISAQVTVPKDISPGEYLISAEVQDPSGSPLTSASYPIELESNLDKGILLKDLHLSIPTVKKQGNIERRIYIDSYGTTGENIPQGTPFKLEFQLENPRKEDLELKTRVNIIPTYSDKILNSFRRDLGTIESGETKDYSFQTAIETPGTYRVVVEIFSSNQELVQKEVRAVVRGSGGSILGITNSQDTYSRGEQGTVGVKIVGPADGATTVKDVQLKLEVIKSGRTLKTFTRKVDHLPFNPETVIFKLTAPEDLDRYLLSAELKKEEKVYDTLEVDYQPLEPERIMTDEGRIKSLEGCFDDGTCTQKELEYGNCLDCEGTQPSVSGENLPVLWLSLLALILVVFIVKRRRS